MLQPRELIFIHIPLPHPWPGVGARGVLWVLLIQPWQDLSQLGHCQCKFRIKTFSLKCFDLSLTCLLSLKKKKNFFLTTPQG